MTTREEFYIHFGPKELEAIVRKLVDEINILRVNTGLPTRTQQQVIEALVEEYENLPDYDWMGD